LSLHAADTHFVVPARTTGSQTTNDGLDTDSAFPLPECRVGMTIFFVPSIELGLKGIDMKHTILVIGLSWYTTAIVTGCTNHHNRHELKAQFVPGLGEIMAQSATRHSKLWFAGQANNWDLAAYEIDELREGFEDAGKYHPSHKDIRQPIPDLIANYMNHPLALLEQAIKDKNRKAFTENYDKLTTACNTCHQHTEFGFNVVTRPRLNPFSNQAFEIK